MWELQRIITQKLVHGFGRHVTKKTNKESILALFRDLHPVECGRPMKRLGRNGDGGYLLPDDLEGIEACFSPGVDKNSSFEFECAEIGMSVFLADASVDGPAIENRSFRFLKKFIGATSNGNYITLTNWIKSQDIGAYSELLLQMDIEGAEYETILSTEKEILQRFRILVVELHFLDEFWSLPFFRVAKAALQKLLETHAVVHIHPNNSQGLVVVDGLPTPRVAEFTFLRRDRFAASGKFMKRTDFPHPLDQDCSNAVYLPMPAWWTRY